MTRGDETDLHPRRGAFDRRRMLTGAAAGLLMAAGSRSLAGTQPSRGQEMTPDPTVAFLGLGPDAERERFDFVFERLSELGTRYGFRLTRLDSSTAADEPLRDEAAIVVFGAGLGVESETERSARIDEKVLKRIRRSVRRGTGLLALHEAAGLWPSTGPLDRNQRRRTPWTDLVGGEMLGAMPSRSSVVRMADRDMPGMSQLGAEFEFSERWLAFKNFDPEMHVVMVQETATLEGELFRRPAYPLTWLRYEGKGRVFYSSLGYEKDGWSSEVMRRCMVGGMLWILRDTEADVSANLMRVTPGAIQATYPT